MSSDDKRIDAVHQALAGSIEAFHSALAATLEDARAELSDGGPASEANGVALGRFAAGRIDMDRFAAVIERRAALEGDGDAAVGLRRAQQTLVELERHADDLLSVDVRPGAALRDALVAALASVGRAFGAARVVERVRSGKFETEVHLAELLGLPFARWQRAERLRAPPLVVRVAGADLCADALAEFLDGSLRLVLVVSGPAPPAPLVRLLTPGTFVLQTTDGQGLERLAAWDGPGIAALLPEGAARFVHDPAAGATLAERLSLQHVPDVAPTQPVGGISRAQMAEQLAQLAQWARLAQLAALTAPPAAASVSASAPADDAAQPTAAAARPTGPADQLAAWLLGQADLTDMP